MTPKQIVFQEMGYSTDSAGGSVEQQAAYVRAVSSYMRESDQLRVLYWFYIHDPLDAFLDSFASNLEGLPQSVVDVFIAELSGLGMCSPTSNGCTLKQPTWNSYLDELRILSGQQQATASSSGSSPFSSSSTSSTSRVSTSSENSSTGSGRDDDNDTSSGVMLASLSIATLVSILLSF